MFPVMIQSDPVNEDAGVIDLKKAEDEDDDDRSARDSAALRDYALFNSPSSHCKSVSRCCTECYAKGQTMYTHNKNTNNKKKMSRSKKTVA